VLAESVAHPADWQAALARIDGMDIVAGLRSVRGRWSTYQRLLQAFLRDHGEDGATLLRELAQDNSELAMRRAHTLKGLAATLGMKPLADQAEQLETLLRTGEADAAQRVQRAQSMAATMDRLVQAVGAALPAQQRPAMAGVDIAHLRSVVEALEHLLAEDDARAVDLHAANAAALASVLGDRATALERHVQRFEFDSASELVLAAMSNWPEAVPPD
jgi:HPt (histidine-containing phosphotransfer) domain-containing protein